jgi:hypothetical protein
MILCHRTGMMYDLLRIKVMSFMAVVLSRHVTGIRDGRYAGTVALITSVALRNVNTRDLCIFSLL